jgi:AcrR family transcriptional regulator
LPQTTKADPRTRLIHSGVKLAYLHGFKATSLADIAKDAKVPVGNLYYYFKTKDEIGEAIVGHHLAQVKTLLQQLDEEDSPARRLHRFIQMTFDNRETVASGGCPIGTFCSELHKDHGALARRAEVLFAEILAWMETQFKALGRASDSRSLAVHLLSALQGVSVLAHNFRDPGMVTIETERLQRWISKFDTKTNKGGTR